MKAKELNTNTNQFRLDKLKRNKTGNKKTRTENKWSEFIPSAKMEQKQELKREQTAKNNNNNNDRLTAFDPGQPG